MDAIAGYRIIRELGGGARSDVLLAHDAEERTVVLRVLHPDATPDGGAALVEALTAVEDEALLPLVDFAMLDDGRLLLVHPRVAGGTLGELRERRGTLEAGEGTTVVSALAGALEALHADGWAHGGVRPDAVLFSLAGAPVLAGPTNIRALDADSLLADAETFRETVLPLLDPASADEIRALPVSPRLMDDIVSTVCSRASPLPVRLRGPRPTLVKDDVFAGLGAASAPSESPRSSLVRDLFAENGPVLELLDRLVHAVRQVRRPVWGAAAGVAVALFAAAVLIPQRDGPAEAADTSIVAAPTLSAENDSEVDSRDDSEPPADSAGSSAEGAYPEPESAAIRGDDPLAATIALLAQRQRCLTARSASCLEGVTQEGSAARSDGLATVTAIDTGEVVPAAPPFDDEAPFVQRTGGSAIVTGGPVSVLVVEGEDGWRLRDLFDGPQ